MSWKDNDIICDGKELLDMIKTYFHHSVEIQRRANELRRQDAEKSRHRESSYTLFLQALFDIQDKYRPKPQAY